VTRVTANNQWRFLAPVPSASMPSGESSLMDQQLLARASCALLEAALKAIHGLQYCTVNRP
jgi:hypothetical protein